MRGSESFLDKPADELEEFLLRIARADVAPEAARGRALQSVASAALGVGMLSGATALGSRSALLKSTGWLVAKWLAVGMSSGLVAIGGAQGLHALATQAESSPPSAIPRAAPQKPPAPRAAAALTPAVISAPDASAEPARELTPPAEASAVVSNAAPIARESKSPPRASSDVAATAPDRRSSLTRELSLLEQARSALSQHAGSSALQTLNDYRKEFPRGSMQIEAAALRVEAVGQTGNRALAQRLAESFLNDFPTSPLAARVRAISEVSIGGEQKP